MMVTLLKYLKATEGIHARYIYHGNADENEVFEKLRKQEGLGVKFAYTMPNTSQQNGQVKQKFATLYSQTEIMLNGGRFSCF